MLAQILVLIVVLLIFFGTINIKINNHLVLNSKEHNNIE